MLARERRPGPEKKRRPSEESRVIFPARDRRCFLRSALGETEETRGEGGGVRGAGKGVVCHGTSPVKLPGENN